MRKSSIQYREQSMQCREIYWLSLIFLIGCLSWWVVSFSLQSASIGDQSLLPTDVEADVNTSIPNPNLQPHDVVRMQVNSIRDARHDISKLKICYSLASPENRSVTGPFQRFAKLVMMPPYDAVANCSDWQLGSTYVDGDLAAVLVSTISNHGEVSGFRFILRRQDLPHPNCWLTEAVLLLPDSAEDFTAIPSTPTGQEIE